MNLEQHSIPYGQKTLTFQLKRSDRKSLAIHVHPNMNVEVIAPQDAELEKVFKKIKKRAQWIKKQQIFFEQFHPKTPARKYQSGETHLYLGKQYRLKISKGDENTVKLNGKFLWVKTLQPQNRDYVQKHVELWFAEKARNKFNERLEYCLIKFKKPHNYTPEGIIIRTLTNRWGSMTPSRRLVLNKKLIHASTASIDYVITHELCHIAHPNHSKLFWKLLAKTMPDWETRKMKLEKTCTV